MPIQAIKSFDELPLSLKVEDVAAVRLGRKGIGAELTKRAAGCLCSDCGILSS